MKVVELAVNGERHRIDLPPGTTLLRALRDRLGLIGTKEGCGRGECGACTVLDDGVPVLSCLVLAERAGAVETIEGLAGESTRLRAAFADHGAFQCGYCTPGQVVRAVALLRGDRQLDEATVRYEMSGNVCRCTGYAAIVRSVLSCADGVTSDADR